MGKEHVYRVLGEINTGKTFRKKVQWGKDLDGGLKMRQDFGRFAELMNFQECFFTFGVKQWGFFFALTNQLTFRCAKRLGAVHIFFAHHILSPV